MKFRFLTADGRTCCDNDNLDHLCEHCRAAALAIPPDPYEEGRRAAASAHDDANYEPYGNAPDSYRLAVARSQKEAR